MMGLRPRKAVLTPAVIYELAKADLTPVLEARPQVAHDLSYQLEQRQAAGHTIAAADAAKRPCPAISAPGSPARYAGFWNAGTARAWFSRVSHAPPLIPLGPGYLLLSARISASILSRRRSSSVALASNSPACC